MGWFRSSIYFGFRSIRICYDTRNQMKFYSLISARLIFFFDSYSLGSYYSFKKFESNWIDVRVIIYKDQT